MKVMKVWQGKRSHAVGRAAVVGLLTFATALASAQVIVARNGTLTTVEAVKGDFVKLTAKDTATVAPGAKGALHRHGLGTPALGEVIITAATKDYLVGKVAGAEPQQGDLVWLPDEAAQPPATPPKAADDPTPNKPQTAAPSKVEVPERSESRSRKAARKPTAKKKLEPTPQEIAAARPANYQSRHFLIHTDLTPLEAQELLERLETMLGLISAYWGRPPSGTIECYVVRDLAKWPADAFPAFARLKIQEGAGVTISQTLVSENRFRSKAIVYSVPERGVPQHEAVHAYCQQTFGNTGPTWYSEGMAEMGNYWVKNDSSVNAEPEVIQFLKSTAPRPLAEIVNPLEPPGTWQEYAWRWALCHLLANNTNYAPRFRPLGMGLLTVQNVSFEQVYAPMAEQISFEYRFFLKHMDRGYRADLCSWEWNKRFTPLTTSNRTISCRVSAQRGWQPTGLTLEAEGTYQIEAEGNWHTGDEKKVGPDGAADGRGKLVGVLLKDFELSVPFDLGQSLTLQAPADGDLYVRCQDDWCELDDNAGSVSVRLKRVEK